MACDRGTVRPENQDATLLWMGGRCEALPGEDGSGAVIGGASALAAGADEHPADGAQPQLMALVADGMGGPPGGAQASQVIVRTVAGALTGGPIPEAAPFLKQLVESANQAVFDVAQRHGLVGMGSTCTMVMFTDGQMHLCHVGDSRCYRIRPRKGSMEPWSRDQNVAAELVEQGVLTTEEARHHRSSHTLTQAVGLGKPLDPQLDSAPVPTGEPELLLLCSDGLLRVFEEGEVLRALMDRLGSVGDEAGQGQEAAAAVRETARHLVELANRRGSPDNISIIMLYLFPQADA